MESVWSENLEDKLIDLWQQCVFLCHWLQNIVNWVTADGCVVRSHRRIRRQSSRIHVHTADADATRRDKTVSSHRRRWCVLGLIVVRALDSVLFVVESQCSGVSI